MAVEKKSFGFLPDGDEVFEYIITNAAGVSVSALSYGCIIRTMMVPDRNSVLGDIVLGFDHLEDYIESTHYIGAVIGRFANRIDHGRFSLQGKSYQLNTNMSPHHLHGGVQGFDKKIWKATPVENEMGSGVTFQYFSVDKEEGFPGNLTIYVQYLLTNENAFIINFVAVSDSPTLLNVTQHSYFNLSGTMKSMTNHGLIVDADFYLPVDETRLVTGKKEPVNGTPFDFRNAKLIGEAFDPVDPQIRLASGLDHCWVLNKPLDILGFAASLYDPGSGRYLEIHTTEPGVQVYTGSSLHGMGKNQENIEAFSGIALETQHFPDSPNHPEFPTTLLLPEQSFTSTTIYRFLSAPDPILTVK